MHSSPLKNLQGQHGDWHTRVLSYNYYPQTFNVGAGAGRGKDCAQRGAVVGMGAWEALHNQIPSFKISRTIRTGRKGGRVPRTE